MTGRVRRPLSALIAGVAAAASAGLVLAGAGGAHAAAPQATAATALPSHVFAPYFEAYNGNSLSGLAADSGNKYLTMAFLQTASAGSCTPDWNGDGSTPVSQANFGSDIATIQAGGGDVIPSFGGYAADSTGTDIADSCTNVNSIAAAYESVITTYNVSRIDLDVEADSLTNAAGLDRRNKAVKLVQDWAAANGRTVQFSYTLPTTTHGLTTGTLGDGSGLSVLKNAVADGVRLDVVNQMTFDYYDGATHEMATDTETASQGLHDELAQLYPSKSDADLWAMIGVTEMPGIDDYGAAETFTTADATTVYNWAVSKGINTLSFWALQRDNGGCPGQGASDSCSGISQSTWQFSHTFEPFTGSTGTGGTTGGGSGGTTGGGTGGGTCTATAWSSSAIYVGGDKVSYGGHTWLAKWWTTGETPGTTGEWGVWEDEGAC
ncbi:putative chitinase [Actinacidiphila reveromycinica]|uniref:chitinase n=1 Tax=Actinacidiphila reveromycinica TaxID=659352 RepID=A0A7U3UNR7_9ACTN|nr:chitinase [Streptomyces sp. SN-593]BBA95911.1 putative chitinase [Streptomyces sp. SN-593]